MRKQLPHPTFNHHISTKDLQYVLEYGQSVIKRDGYEYIALNEFDVPLEDRKKRHVRRLINTVVVISPSGDVVGCYKNRKKCLKLSRRYQSHRRDSYRFRTPDSFNLSIAA